MNHKTKIAKTLNYAIRLVIIVATYVFVYRQVFYQKDLSALLREVVERSEKSSFWPVLAGVVLLMFLNWGLETAKWKLLMGKIEPIPFLRAFRAVMTGVSVSMFTPNRVGEYFGRVFILKKGSHIQGILITVIGSMSQLLITLAAGLASLFLFLIIQDFLDPYISGQLHLFLVFAVPPVLALLLFLYFRIPRLTPFLVRHWKAMAVRLRKYAEVFSWYSRKELFSVLILSFLRYLVFTLQFYIILRLLGVPLPLPEGIMLISLIYLGLTLFPTVALAELGVRGSVSIFLINAWFIHERAMGADIDASILAASSLVWIINLVIPALMGTVFVFNLKFFRK